MNASNINLNANRNRFHRILFKKFNPIMFAFFNKRDNQQQCDFKTDEANVKNEIKNELSIHFHRRD